MELINKLRINKLRLWLAYYIMPKNTRKYLIEAVTYSIGELEKEVTELIDEINTQSTEDRRDKKMRSIEEVMEMLKDKSEMKHPGKMGVECYVEKKLLEEASIYLQDYLYILEQNENNGIIIDEAEEINAKKVENIKKCFDDLVLGKEPIILKDISKKNMDIKLGCHMSFAEIEDFAFIMYTVLNNIKKEIESGK